MYGLDKSIKILPTRRSSITSYIRIDMLIGLSSILFLGLLILPILIRL